MRVWLSMLAATFCLAAMPAAAQETTISGCDTLTFRADSGKKRDVLSSERHRGCAPALIVTDVFQARPSRRYRLRFSPVVDGGEQVRVDGRRRRLGFDYTIDYNRGVLRFRKGATPASRSTVEVSYEYRTAGTT